MTDSLPPLGPAPARPEGLPPLPPRPATPGGGLPPLGATAPPGPGAPPPGAGMPAATAVPPTPPPGPRGVGGRTPGRTLTIALALLAGAVAGAGTTFLLDDSPGGSSSSAPITADSEAPGARPLQDAIAAVDGSVVQVRTPTGLGSGVITQPKGLIITNEHVAGAQGDEVSVITADRRTVPATVVASNAQQDLAVLKPRGSVGQGVQLAPEPDAALRPGDPVFAIGSPFGLQGTVTVGVVSAVNRPGESGMPMIQTDAPINPGNSGGGLFDLRGRLVGVPTSINSPVPGNVGIGFAVTTDYVRRILESVK